jgi:hypothetical protein
MSLPHNFVQSLRFIHPRELFAMVANKTLPKGGSMLQLRNEVRPIDLYCYLGARFGIPNGIQNFLRTDDSDNLIHWEWTLAHDDGLVFFAGLNFRTEVTFRGPLCASYADRDGLVAQLKADFAHHGQQMTVVRRSLEHWIEFVNPYQRIRTAVEQLMKEVDALKLRPEEDRLDNILDGLSPEHLQTAWKETAERYTRGFGLCFGVRSMLPVMAEAFVNLLLYVLLRPELKADQRLRDNVFRQPIDIRVKSLALNCQGFKTAPDYSSQACKNYHTLVNERNDLLHGNVVIDKLQFNEVYFHGKVPVFREYRTMWERSIGMTQAAVGLDAVKHEISVVNDFTSYLMSCLEDPVRGQMELIVDRYDLGLNTKTQRLGVLFPPWLVDMKVGFK